MLILCRNFAESLCLSDSVWLCRAGFSAFGSRRRCYRFVCLEEADFGDFGFVDGLEFALGFVDSSSDEAKMLSKYSPFLDAPLALAFFTEFFFVRSFFFSCSARSSASICSCKRSSSRVACVFFSISSGFRKAGWSRFGNRGSSSSVGELKSLTVAEEGSELEDSWMDSCSSSCCFWMANAFSPARMRPN